MNKINKAVILAGGRGTRLSPFTDKMPKPMFPINNVPFFGYLLKQIKSFGILEVILLLGYLPDVIMDYFGNGSLLGMNIKYSVSDEENETQKRIYLAKEMINDDFLLLYCDNFCPVDFKKMQEQFFGKESLIQITAYTNKDLYTKNNVFATEAGTVEIYDKTRTEKNLNCVDIGYVLIKKNVLDMINVENVNFEKNMYPMVLKRGRMGVFLTQHRYYSIGSYDRIEITERFFSNQKVAFVDRDGTINYKPPKAMYITNAKDFKWIPGSIEAVKILNEHGYIVILVTNQPGIARGMLTMRDLEDIHAKMLDDLRKEDAGFDRIYTCVHGWNDDCDCRKPKPGMLFNAQKDFNFNMQNAIFFGDDERDMAAAEAAGCRGILINNDNTLFDAVKLEVNSKDR